LCDFPGVNVSQGAQEQDGRTLKLLDWYIDLAPKAAARARIGQFKVPFGRQELVSDNKLQMTSRGIASDFFAPGRDRGAMFHGGTDTQQVQYKVGVFNGTGLALSQNVDKSLAYAARLTATSSGPFLDVEDVIDQPPSLGVRVQGGIAWYQSTDTPIRLNPQIPESDVKNTRWEADLGIFFRQRGNLFFEYYQRKWEVEQNFDLPASCYGAQFVAGRFSCDQAGYTIQGGVRLTNTDHHEMSARYSWIDNDRDLEKDTRTEATLNYAYFFFRHTMQLSASVSLYKLGVNAQGSSGFYVKAANPAANFLDDSAFPGLQGDKNILGTVQFQWTF
jgi:phosphate-selective porin OprO/OprP